MKKNYRFLALRIRIGTDEYTKSILVVDEAGRLQSIQPIDSELANTRYMEGKLWVLPQNVDPDATTELTTLQQGDAVTVWQMLPYDLMQNKPLPQTRIFRVTLS